MATEVFVTLNVPRPFEEVVIDAEDIRLKPLDRWLTFQVFHKTVQLGGFEFDQYWLPVPGLYGVGTGVPNHLPVCRAYWDLCRQAGTTTDQHVRESYLLARVAPFIRTVSSSRVVCDSRLGRAGLIKKDSANLNEMIRRGSTDPLSEADFHARTGRVLGPPSYDAGVAEKYEEMAAGWLNLSADQLSEDEEGAVEKVIAWWKDRVRRVGRRAGHQTEKAVLNILSYEALAAVRRCLSAVWVDLLSVHLTMLGRLSAQSRQFHEFWLCDPVRPSAEGDPTNFHVFHGHAFGLHPAGASFMRTEAGRNLLGDWLAAAEAGTAKEAGYAFIFTDVLRLRDRERLRSEAYGRLLKGILIAVIDYSGRREEIAENRNFREDVYDPDMLEDLDNDKSALEGRKNDEGRPSEEE